jgi:predicted dehydrogenase
VPLAGADRPADSGIDDVLALTLELERGAIATVQVVWQRNDLPRTYELDVIGDGARVECVLDPDFRATGLADGTPVDLRAAGAPSVRSMERFLAAARASTPGAVACTPAQAARSLATALACEGALQSGGRVSVDAPA